MIEKITTIAELREWVEEWSLWDFGPPTDKFIILGKIAELEASVKESKPDTPKTYSDPSYRVAYYFGFNSAKRRLLGKEAP
jgi:hypothetical protein